MLGGVRLGPISKGDFAGPMERWMSTLLGWAAGVWTWRCGAVAARTLVLAGGLVYGLVGTGCQPAVRNQGQEGLLATYSMMTLTADLPERARVQAVIAAADAVVRSRGYGVELVRATEEEGSLLAIPPKSAGSPRVWIHAARVEGGTRVRINPQPWGDEDVARSLLDGILARLGM